MVRAGVGTAAAAAFLAESVVAIGWYDVDWTKCPDSHSIQARISALAPVKSQRQRIAAASQIERFLRAIQIGDAVVTHHGERRAFYIGTIKGVPVFDPKLIPGLATYRRVLWEGVVPREKLSHSTLKALGAISTLFLIRPSAAAELEKQEQPI